MSIDFYLALAAVLLVIGLIGFLVRHNMLVLFMSVELMLNACNLVLVAFSQYWGHLHGQVASFFVMVVAAAEVTVGLAIIVSMFRARRSTSVDDVNLMKF